MINNRIAIFIDGSNLYHKLKDLKIEHTSRFDYFGLANKFVKDRQTVYLGYYIGVVKAGRDNQKGQILRKEQQRLFNLLNQKGFCLKKGYLMLSDGKYHEKGVDVQIATDLLIGAYENFYDTAIVISSDTDLIPAIKKVKSLGKRVEYVGFSHQPSFALIKNATLTHLLLRADLENYIYKLNP
jgi:uncharacterized LabA/DUF88 family protein